MHLSLSIVLASLLLNGAIVLPATPTSHAAHDTLTWNTHLVQKQGQPKHRGSGRRDFVSLSEIVVG